MANPNDSSTVLLLHMDGSDGGSAVSDFADSSTGGAHGNATSVEGNAQLDDAQQKFGATSGRLDGTGDYVTFADHADWNFGSGEVTIDFWVRFAALPTDGNHQYFISQYSAAPSAGWYIRIVNSGGTYTLNLFGTAAGGVVGPYSWTWSTPSTAQFYHIALIRGWGGNANDWAITVDGIQLGSEQTDSDDMPDAAGALWIGDYEGDAGNCFNGWIDEIRISKGAARWTANFEVPSAPYPDADQWSGTVNGVQNPTEVATIAATGFSKVAGVTTIP